MVTGAQGQLQIPQKLCGEGESLLLSNNTDVQTLVLQIQQYDPRLVFEVTTEERSSVLQAGSERAVGRLSTPLPDSERIAGFHQTSTYRYHGSCLFLDLFLNQYHYDNVAEALGLAGNSQKAESVKKNWTVKVARTTFQNTTCADMKTPTPEMDESRVLLENFLMGRGDPEVNLGDVRKIASFLSQKPLKALIGTVYASADDVTNPFRGYEHLPLPPESAFTDENKVGSGRSGVVGFTSHKGQTFACKRTLYRTAEWRFLNHVSEIKRADQVLAIPLARQFGEFDPKTKGNFVYYYMQCAQTDARTEVSKLGPANLCNLLLKYEKDAVSLELIVRNAQILMTEILNGIAFIHRQGYVHGDIKLENTLLFLPTEDIQFPDKCSEENIFLQKKGFPLARIADFGMTHKAADLPPYDAHSKKISKIPKGTPGYQAPFFPKRQTAANSENAADSWKKMDVWSFGFLTVKLFTGHSGIKREEEYKQLASFWLHEDSFCQVLEGKPIEEEQLEYLKTLRERVYKDLKLGILRDAYPRWPHLVLFVAVCLVPDPEIRPSADELLGDRLYGTNKEKRLNEIRKWIKIIFPPEEFKQTQEKKPMQLPDHNKLHGFWQP